MKKGSMQEIFIENNNGLPADGLVSVPKHQESRRLIVEHSVEHYRLYVSDLTKYHCNLERAIASCKQASYRKRKVYRFVLG
jgi:hypothetical protein